MWNVISANPVMDRRNKYKARMKHLQALHNVKGQVDNKSPVRPVFMSLRQKKHQLRKEKDKDIHYENDILIDRMITAKSSLPEWEAYRPQSTRSLSRNYRRKMQRQIDLGNQRIIKKLQEVESTYPLHKILDETDNYLVYRCNIQHIRAPSLNLNVHQSDRSLIKTPTSVQGIHRPLSAKRQRPFSAKR